MKLRLVSFGYKYGRESEEFNMFYDARFLQNPYWEDNLRHLTGRDEPIKQYILSHQSSEKYLKALINAIESNLEHYKDEMFSIGVACSGGQHRSVFVVEYIYEYFKDKLQVEVFHRDIDKIKASNKKSRNYKDKDQNPKIVCFGGGHGLSNLLQGLKKLPFDIVAVVNVTDDGGSTGLLRELFKMPAPGDIRRVLLSLSSEEELYDKLFNYRFNNNDVNLKGHALGNLLLAAAYEFNNNDFLKAVDDLAKIMHIKGQVLPIASSFVHLTCHYEDGDVVVGESKMIKNKKIDHISASQNVTINKKVINEILNADLIVFSQGSLYSSLIANLIFPEVKRALKMSSAKIIYIANLLTQQGETNGYTVSDHIKAIEKEIGDNLIDTVIINNNYHVDKDILNKYAEEGSYLLNDFGQIRGKELIVEDFIDVDDRGQIRHKNRKVASRLYEIALDYLE